MSLSPLNATADTMVLPPSVRLDAEGRIDDDIPCRKCGYNLRSLAATGRCTECGTAVGRSLMGDLLRFCDPDWVQNLASGMNWIIFGSLAAGAMGLVVGAWATVFQPTAMPFATFLIQLIAGVFPVIGYWKLTQPDPSGMGESPGITSRKLTRVLSIAGYAAAPVQSVLVTFAVALGMALAVLNGLSGIVLMFALFTYGRSIALRIPDDKLARNCRIVMWGYGLVGVLSMTFLALALFVRPGGMPIMPLPIPATGPAPAAATAPVGSDGTPTAHTMELEGEFGESKDDSIEAERPELEGEEVDEAEASKPGAAATGARRMNSRVRVGSGPVAGAPGPALPRGGVAGLVGFGLAACVFGTVTLVFSIWSLILVFRFRRALKEAAWQARNSWVGVARPLSAG